MPVNERDAGRGVLHPAAYVYQIAAWESEVNNTSDSNMYYTNASYLGLELS